MVDRQRIEQRIGKASCSNALALLIDCIETRELCTKAKLAVFRSIFVSILVYSHECWVITEKVRSRVQAAEMVFLLKVRGLTLLDKVKSTDISQFINIKLLMAGAFS